MLKTIKVRLIILAVLVFMMLYAPFELTRIILGLQRGLKFYAPWYWVAEIIAIWVGFIIAMPFIWKGIYEIQKGFLGKKETKPGL